MTTETIDTGTVRVHVGNLHYDATRDDLRQAVEALGYEVTDAHVVIDRDVGRSRGFGFVTVRGTDAAEAAAAIQGLVVLGRSCVAKVALPRQGPAR